MVVKYFTCAAFTSIFIADGLTCAGVTGICIDGPTSNLRDCFLQDVLSAAFPLFFDVIVVFLVLFVSWSTEPRNI